MIKNILIDVDGTLMDTQDIFFRSLKMALKKHNLNRELDPSLFGLSVDQALAKLNIGSVDGIKEDWETFFSEECGAINFYSGIENMMRILSEKGIRFFIITSRSHRTVDPICNMSAIGPFINGCIAAEDTEFHKPDPEPLLAALKILGSSLKEAIYIGDTYQDYKASVFAGIKFGFAGWNKKAVNRGYDIVFTAPSDIISMIEDSSND